MKRSTDSDFNLLLLVQPTNKEQLDRHLNYHVEGWYAIPSSSHWHQQETEQIFNQDSLMGLITKLK
jgi:hypothetical protein